MFGASQLWGKVGRAFLRVISERQYARHPPDGSFSLGSVEESSGAMDVLGEGRSSEIDRLECVEVFRGSVFH